MRNIAHELGSPLTRIKLGLAVIESQVEPEIQARVESVSNDVEEVKNLIEDIMSFLRTESSPASVKRKTVLLRPLLQRIVDKDAQGVEVNLEVDDKLNISVDVECICRAVSNAVRYAASPITIQAQQEGEVVRTAVRDQGPGVEENELEAILKPFYRGKSAAGTPGTGLGLSIVKHSVEMMNGSVECRNCNPGFSVIMLLRMQAAGM